MSFIKSKFINFLPLTFILLFGCVAAPEILTSPINNFTRAEAWDNWSASIATFNTWGLPVLSKNIDERMIKIAEELKGKQYDFVMLEEAWREKDRKNFVKRSGLPYGQNFSVPRTIGSGLFNLSSVPFQRSSFREFTLNGHLKDITEADAYAGKGASMSTVKIKGLPVSFFSTHTIARYNNDSEHLEDSHTVDRLLQLFEVYRQIVEQTDSDAFVVAGDFNMRYFHTEYLFWQQLTSLEGFSAEEYDSNFCTYCPDNAFHKDSEGQLDYIFISPRLELYQSRVDFDQKFISKSGKLINLSDHYGITSEIRVKDSPSLISYETAKANCLNSVRNLRSRLDFELNLASKEIQTSGIEDRVCRSCRIKEGILSLKNFEKALNPSLDGESEYIFKLRVRLESYFNLFKN